MKDWSLQKHSVSVSWQPVELILESAAFSCIAVSQQVSNNRREEFPRTAH